jgi:polysaccharide export outer membrane protein
MKIASCSAVTGLLFVLGFGCAAPKGQFDDRLTAAAATNYAAVKVSNHLPADLLKPSDALFTLGPGDSLEIEIVGNPLSRVVTPVGLDGKIYFHLLPGLDVWGLTLEQTREILERELDKFVRNPQIAVNLHSVGSKYVWLLGRLNKPGIFPLTGSMTLLESLAMAGGTSRSTLQTANTRDLADLRHSFVVRQGQFVPVDFHRLLLEGDTSQNIMLQPEDFIYVPSALANEVYVLGAVRVPRAVTYTEPMTLVSALAGASGAAQYDLLSRDDAGPFMKDAYVSHVAIVRGSLTEPTVTIVDYNAILKGRASDVRLEAGDIIYVPNTPYTTLKRYVNLIVNTFVTTVAANEGVRAGGGNVGIGVSVPVGTGR